MKSLAKNNIRVGLIYSGLNSYLQEKIINKYWNLHTLGVDQVKQTALQIAH